MDDRLRSNENGTLSKRAERRAKKRAEIRTLIEGTGLKKAGIPKFLLTPVDSRSRSRRTCCDHRREWEFYGGGKKKGLPKEEKGHALLKYSYAAAHRGGKKKRDC